MKIARYCLLSWAMYFSRINKQLGKKLRNQDKFQKKGLMNQQDYAQLFIPNGSKTGWADKWWIPLNWASMEIKKTDATTTMIKKDHKQIIKTLAMFQEKLVKFDDFQSNTIPHIQTQAVTSGLWVYFIMGIFADHSLFLSNNDYQHQYPLYVTIPLSFPIFKCIMYLLLFAWLKVGEKLKNPFNSFSHQCNLDLVSQLDFEIWKASHLLAQQSYPKDLYKF